MGHLMRRDGHLMRRDGHLQNSDDKDCCCGGACCLYLTEDDLPRGDLIATFSDGGNLDGQEINITVSPTCGFDPGTECGANGTYLGQRGGIDFCPTVTFSICICCEPDETGCAQYLMIFNVADMLGDCDGGTVRIEATSCSCDPFELVFEGVPVTGTCGCEGTYTITITEAP